jgi:hypothetical protein
VDLARDDLAVGGAGASHSSGATVLTTKVRLRPFRLQVKLPLLVKVPSGNGSPGVSDLPAAGVKVRIRS